MKRTIVAILALAFITGAVGLGVHLMHRDAFAQVFYQVYVYQIVDEVPIPVDDAELTADFGVGWEEPDLEGDGYYKWLRNVVDDWDAQIGNEGVWIGVDPPGLFWVNIDGTQFYVEWEVEPD